MKNKSNEKYMNCKVCKTKKYIPKCREKTFKYCSVKCRQIGKRGQVSHRKGMTLEQEYGGERAKEIRKLSSKKHKGKKITEIQLKNLELGRTKNSYTKERCKKISLAMKGKTQTEQHKKRMVNTRMKNESYKYGSEHILWRGGKSFEPYTSDFNKKLKKLIKERDKYKCFLCNKKTDLCIHHIDYNKNNSSPENLITLCRKCHGVTGVKRKKWIKFFFKRIIK